MVFLKLYHRRGLFSLSVFTGLVHERWALIYAVILYFGDNNFDFLAKLGRLNDMVDDSLVVDNLA